LNQEENIAYAKQVSFLEENVFDFSNPECEKKISQSIQHNHFVAGYGFGIARLLLYLLFKKGISQDVMRFQYIF
jgi:hypothetical protein